MFFFASTLCLLSFRLAFSSNCREPLLNEFVHLQAFGNNSASEGDPINGTNGCPRRYAADATKCFNCTASLSVHDARNQGSVTAETFEYWDKSEVNLNGSLTVGCCSSLTGHGEVFGDATSFIEIGNNSDVTLINLLLLDFGSMSIGESVTLESGIGYNKITVEDNSSFVVESPYTVDKQVHIQFENGDVTVRTNSSFICESNLLQVFGNDKKVVVSDSQVHLETKSVLLYNSEVSLSHSTLSVLSGNRNSFSITSTVFNLDRASVIVDQSDFSLDNSSITFMERSLLHLVNGQINFQNVAIGLSEGATFSAVNTRLVNDQWQPIKSLILGKGAVLHLALRRTCVLTANIHVPDLQTYDESDLTDSLDCSLIHTTTGPTTTSGATTKTTTTTSTTTRASSTTTTKKPTSKPPSSSPTSSKPTTGSALRIKAAYSVVALFAIQLAILLH